MMMQPDQLIDDETQLANATDYVTADHVEYTIFEHTDNANQFGIFLASNESCSSSKRISDTTRRTLDTCANNPQKAGPNPQCCYDFGSGTLVRLYEMHAHGCRLSTPS